ncbi:MAG: hypothetical protein IID33_03145 [Planctomycetes bacterium]|nr:hypothetical protein [Planctomycetota bacterium]
MNLGLFEDNGWRNLLPLTYLRACFELRCGRDRLCDKVQTHFGRPIARSWMREQIAAVVTARCEFAASDAGDWCLVNARAFVTADQAPPAPGKAWIVDGELIAAGFAAADIEHLKPETLLRDDGIRELLSSLQTGPSPAGIRLIKYPWELPLLNGDELRRQCTEGGNHDGRIHGGVHLLNPAAIHVAADAVIKPGTVLDAESGPIHIDADVTIEPNCVIQGPCHIGRGSLVQPGSSIRHDTSIGPVCKVGGEIEASIIHGYSNKQHDGFLGHSYVGQWVNLGADTVTSDLKNTYGTIRVHLNGRSVETGERFVGSIIGDHTKTGIGTILPTGCVLGTASNVFTRGAVPNFVPSFSWLTSEGMTDFRIDKAIEIARTVMARRKVDLTRDEEELIRQTAELARRIESPG